MGGGGGGGPQLTCWGSPDHEFQHTGTTETVVTGLPHIWSTYGSVSEKMKSGYIWESFREKGPSVYYKKA